MSNRSAGTLYSESFSHFFNSSAGTRITPDVPFNQSSPASVSTRPETLPGLWSSFQCIRLKRLREKRTTPPDPPSHIWSPRTETTATEIFRVPSGKEKRWYVLPSHSTNLFENANHTLPSESPAIAPITPGLLPRASVTLVHEVPTRWYESGVRVVIHGSRFRSTAISVALRISPGGNATGEGSPPVVRQSQASPKPDDQMLPSNARRIAMDCRVLANTCTWPSLLMRVRGCSRFPTQTLPSSPAAIAI